MQQTTNYNLNVIEQNDKILDSVTALGQNATSIDTILAGKQDNITIATSITSSSTNSEVAGAKAVYDATLDNYSTTEQVVGTWINGKPLYRKTIDLGTLPSTTGTGVNYPHNISNLESVVQWNAVGINKNNSYQGFAIPYAIDSNTLVGLYWNITYVVIKTTVDRSGFNGIVTLYYTKTTDSATRSLNLMKSANEEETEEKELEEKEPVEEVKQEETKEPILEEIVEEETKAEGSGDAR